MSEKPGFQSTLEMLRGLEPEMQERILNDVAKKDPELAQKLMAEMLSFEDLKDINANGLREILKESSEPLLALAFRNASEDLKNAFYSQMSQRAAQSLKEFIDTMGPQPLSKVQEAQKGFVDLARRLESEGKLVIKSAGDPLV